ncbi:MAG: tetratricopeptide repeat protein [Nitrospirae bacterium]|nr:tetratricopeptide repeat protein [Nitrospirota bacterium]
MYVRKEDPDLLRIPWEFLFDGASFLSAYEGVTLSRSIKGVPSNGRGKIRGVIKMLAVISSPLDLNDRERLQVEKEQMLLLQAVDRAYAENRIEIDFLDESSLRNIQARLDEEEYHILHYTGHGSYSQREDRGYLLLEDDSGRSRHEDNEAVAELLSGYDSLRLVVLSGCQTAKTSGRQAMSDLTTALILRNVPAVVSMQYSVTDDSAINLAMKFYTELVNGSPVDLALTRARKELLLREGHGAVDFATPVLFCDDHECLKTEVRDSVDAGAAFQKRIEIKPNIVLGLEQLGAQFIGRRKEIRRIKDDFFSRGIRAVVLHGIGGIGKTVTAAKTVEKFQDNFHGVFAFDCRQGLTAEEIFMKLNDFLNRIGVDALNKVSTEPIPIEVKMQYLAQVLSQVRLLLIFDNLETLISKDEKSCEIADVELKKALKTLVTQCKDSTKFIFTSRYTFNLTDGRLTNVMDEINLGELSQPEAIMVMNRFPDIAKEDFDRKIEIHEKIGGHPYTINIFGQHARHKSVDDVLKDIGEVNKDMVEFTLLDISYKNLSVTARDLINRVSVFKKSIPLEGLEWMMKDNGESPRLKKEIEELIHWGLIIMMEDDYQVHTIVKDFIKTKVEDDDWRQCLIKAAKYYEAAKGVWEYLDARELYLEAGEFDEAGIIVSDVTEYLHRWGLIELVRRLNKDTVETASGLTQARALHNLGVIHQAQGEYDKAIEKYNQSMKIKEELGGKSGIASTLHQLGMIHQVQGDYDRAIEKYNQRMKISEELGNKSGIAITLHQLGMIHQVQGDYDRAIEKYNQSMKIKEELGNKSGIAITLHQLGNIHYEQGDYDRAIEKYNQSMKISEEFGNKSGIAITLHQIGNIHWQQGDYDWAIEKYNQSMKIEEELGNKSGIASTLGQLGRIYEVKEDYKNALKNYLICFSMFESLKSPYAELAAKEINKLKEKIGEETFKKYWEEIVKEVDGKEDE